jgi:serine/threonine protein kinase
MEDNYLKFSNLLNKFNWYYKNLFIWKEKSFVNGKRSVYYGEKKEGKKLTVVLKIIKIDNNYSEILKELYFLVCCKDSEYFVKIIDFFVDEDKTFAFFILKDGGVSLKELIDYSRKKDENFNYKNIKNFIKWILFQIISGLYILHKKELIHHDVKLGNILISPYGEIKITDFGSADKTKTKRSGTLLYKSPNRLLNKHGTEKDDMWSVGIILAELYIMSYPFNPNPNNPGEDKEIAQLRGILSKYELMEGNAKININNKKEFDYIKKCINEKRYYFKSKLNKINEIDDEDAFDLLENLLQIDPQKRYSAEQALNSKYFSVYSKEFKNCDLIYNKNDYKLLLSNVQDLNSFLGHIELIKQKFFGDILFEK